MLGDVVPFKDNVDPKGALAAGSGDNFVHTADNQVEYYECIKHNDGSQRCDDPAIFFPAAC